MLHRFHLSEKTDPHWIGEFVQFPGHANPWRRLLLFFFWGGLWNLGGFEIHAPRFQPYWIHVVLFSCCFLFFSGNFPQLFFCPLPVAMHPLLPSILESMYIVIYYLASWHDLSIQPLPPPSQGGSLRENCCETWKHNFCRGARRYVWKG